MNDGNGPAFFTAGNVDTYVNLKPVTATEAATGSSSATWIAIAVIAVAVDRARRGPGAAPARRTRDEE